MLRCRQVLLTALLALLLATPSAAIASPGAIQRLSVNSTGQRITGSSNSPDISADGAIVAFTSDADLTGVGATTTGVFVLHTATGALERIRDGKMMGLSDDGRYVATTSIDEDDVQVFDLNGPFPTTVPLPPTSGPVYGGRLSANGRYLLYLPTIGGSLQVAVADLVTGTVTPTANPDLRYTEATISDDGRYIAFVPSLTNHPVEVLDRQTNQIVYDPSGYSQSYYVVPEITADGSHVLFTGAAGPGQGTHALVGDIASGQTTDLTPTEPGDAFVGRWDSTGRYATYTTTAAQDPADTATDFDYDVYTYDMLSGQTRLASANAQGVPGDNLSGWPYRNQGDPNTAIADDGRTVVFNSYAADLVADDGTGIGEIESQGHNGPLYRSDIYLKTLDTTAPPAPPKVTCDAAPTGWHGADVSVSCSATAQAGLADPGDASFTLGTSVADGSQTATASTGTHQVCDQAGACTTAGPVGPIKVDRAPPTIAVTTPSSGASFTRGQTVDAAYGCADGGSGIAASGGCVGSVADGAALDTVTAGTHSFTVTATDGVGHTASKTITYTVTAPSPCGSGGGSYCQSVAQTSGLTNFWRLDGSASTHDLIGNVAYTPGGANLSYVAGATGDGDSALKIYNGSLGAQGWITATPSVDMSGRRPWTIEFWFKDGTNAPSPLTTAFGNWYGSTTTGCAGNPSVCMFITSSPAFNRVLARGNQAYVMPPYSAVSDTTLTNTNGVYTFAPQWTLLAVTYDGSTVTLYKDGVQQAQFASTDTLGTNPITRFFTTNDALFDELAIYDRALTTSQLSNHYNNR